MRQDALEITLREFLALAEIPRPSHHEEKVGAYLVEWAKKHGLCVTQDEIGDVIIDKVASPGCENADRVIIQAHMQQLVRVFLAPHDDHLLTETPKHFMDDKLTP